MSLLISDKCIVNVDKDSYYPGQVLTGNIELRLKSDRWVKALNVVLHGEGSINIYDDKNAEPVTEEYVNKEIELLLSKKVSTECETVLCSSGTHKHAFLFDLPKSLPSSLSLKRATIMYKISAELELAGAAESIVDSKIVTIAPNFDLNNLPASAWKPITRTEVNDLICVCFRTKPLSVRVQLPCSAYVPSELISFTCEIKNQSKMNVSKVGFKILQVYEMITKSDVRRKEIRLKKEYIEDSAVRKGQQKFFNVNFQIPDDVFVPNLTNCQIINMHCELVGKVVVPYPHFDLLITIPFTIGTIPKAPTPLKLF